MPDDEATLDHSLLRSESPNLIEQRLRGDRATEELFQQQGSFLFFAKAEQALAGPGVPLRVASFKRPQSFPRVLPNVG